MAARDAAAPPSRRTPDAPASADAAADRFDALLEARFDPAQRGAMARELDAHDRRPRPAPAMPPAAQSVRFVGPVAEPVRLRLQDWIPKLIALAARHGLRLREARTGVDVYQRQAYEERHGPIPPTLKLPASSYSYNPLYRHYTVRVILPERLGNLEDLVTVLRAQAARMFGDIFLREEVFALEPYREDLLTPAAEISVGMAEKLLLLGEGVHTSPELEAALADHAAVMGMNFRRAPGPVRKSYFGGLRQSLDGKGLPQTASALVERVFGDYLTRLRQDIPATVARLVAATEQLNLQMNFLPPDELPDYLRLRESDPPHYLRSAKLRLEFALEAMAAVIEDVALLEQGPAGLTPVEEERVDGYLAALTAQRLARPYLVGGVRLSDEQERRRKAFPLEVHELMQRLPPQPDPARQFKSLSQRIEGSLYQRLYQAFLFLRHGIRLRERGRGPSFADSPHFGTLKGLAANFKFRRPLLETHFAQLGIALDLSEAAAHARERFPVGEFTRAWGQFAAHALLAEFLAGERKGFDAGRYWNAVDAALRPHLAGGGTARVAHLLRRLHVRAQPAGLATLAEMLRRPTGTLRFAVSQAATRAPVPAEASSAAQSPAAAEAQVERWVEAILHARAAGLRHAEP
jgi:hypothetical protein